MRVIVTTSPGARPLSRHSPDSGLLGSIFRLGEARRNKIRPLLTR
jgi:hypothetical protein